MDICEQKFKFRNKKKQDGNTEFIKTGRSPRPSQKPFDGQNWNLISQRSVASTEVIRIKTNYGYLETIIEIIFKDHHEKNHQQFKRSS